MQKTVWRPPADPKPWTRVLPAPLRGVLGLAYIIVETLFWFVGFAIAGLIGRLIRNTAVGRLLLRLRDWFVVRWIRTNWLLVPHLVPTRWALDIDPDLDPDEPALILSNHQSWTDILAGFWVPAGNCPPVRFFLKQELLYVPIVGWVAWILDMPFMRRYGPEVLKKRPELRGKDIEATRIACRRFADRPISLLVYAEGTRFTPAKRDAQGAPYRRLLKPKIGGMAFAVDAMEGRIRTVVDMTIAYPDGIPTFFGFWAGRVPRIVVRLRRVPIPERFLTGTIDSDRELRADFASWVGELWAAKDADLVALEGDPTAEAA